MKNLIIMLVILLTLVTGCGKTPIKNSSKQIYQYTLTLKNADGTSTTYVGDYYYSKNGIFYLYKEGRSSVYAVIKPSVYTTVEIISNN